MGNASTPPETEVGQLAIINFSNTEGKPFRFKLGAEQVIPGLDMGVSQLSVGERAKMTIPSHLAYGERGFPGLVPGNTDLIFDIELISYT